MDTSGLEPISFLAGQHSYHIFIVSDITNMGYPLEEWSLVNNLPGVVTIHLILTLTIYQVIPVM